MKIVVLNGSPKGELSVTMQYVAYLAKVFPQHEFQIISITQRIKRLENERPAFDEVIAQVRAADAILWGFPLYILIVHAHYKRFIELIFERGVQDAFRGKYAASLSTSIHFFDHTAHQYIHAISDDLGMRFIDSFSPEMDDLLQEENRRQLVQFGQRFLDAVQARVPTQRQYPPLLPHAFSYQPGPAAAPAATAGKKVVILHDNTQPGSNLEKMVARCRAAFTGDVQVINLHDVEIKGSCLGCIQCGAANHCAYEGKDGFVEFYRETVMTADMLVYAGSIVDRYFSSRWKMFFDRAFFNTHTPVLEGKQLAFIISGPFHQLPMLREILAAYGEFQYANLTGFVSDETETSADLDQLIDQLMLNTLEAARTGYVHPQTFLGVAGMKVFRDDIWGRLRFVFRADHRAYQRMGIYKTFPQNDLPARMNNAFMAALFALPPVRQGFGKQIKKQMVLPLQKVVEKA